MLVRGGGTRLCVDLGQVRGTMASRLRLATYTGTRGRLSMDYHALGLGEAASVVTAVSIDQDEHTIIIACLYEPQDTQMPYTLCFKQCTHIVWQPFEGRVPDAYGYSFETPSKPPASSAVEAR